jgi:hypothetical protein
MKINRKRIYALFVVLLFICLPIIAQVKSERTLDAFDKISALGDVEIQLVKGDTAKITVSAPTQQDIESLTIKNENGELKLNRVKGLFQDVKTVRITVYYKLLRSIEMQGSASALVDKSLKGDKINLVAGTGGQIVASVAVNSVEASVGQGSVITLSGTTETQKASAGSGGVYSAFQLSSKTAYTEANTGGKVKVTVSENIEAKANTGGYIGYAGNPQKSKIKTLFGGTIEQTVASTDN